jgi:hypothetical protein
MVNRLFAALCSWLITCFTLIRFLNIFQRFNTIRSNIILVTCLTIIFFIANSYLLVTLGYDRRQKNENPTNNSNEQSINETRCYIRDEYENSRLTLLLNTLVAGFLNLVLPSMLTLIVNITILCYIKRIYKTQNSENIPRHSDNSGTVYRSTRSTLLVISMTYTLCYLPYCIIYLLLIQFGDTNGTLFYWSEIAFILRYISHSINFYAYIFTNHRFRRDIILLLRYLLRPRLCKITRNKPKKKINLIPQHQRLRTSTPVNITGEKKIRNNQAGTCIKFQNQTYLERKQMLQTTDGSGNKQKTVVAVVTLTNSSDKYIKKATV